ncbi:unnamed protein product [Malus baccata var. baccata]
MDLKKPISNLTDVALRITKQLLTTEGKGKNMVYSLLSLQVLLSSVTAGSKGPTKKQFVEKIILLEGIFFCRRCSTHSASWTACHGQQGSSHGCSDSSIVDSKDAISNIFVYCMRM